MDSLTQIVLGAAVGEAVLGHKIGNKSLALGAIAGTVPDLDVLISAYSDNPLMGLKVHRAYSHSMFFHLLLALPFAWLSQKWSKSTVFKEWYLFWFLGFFTHALLDCCTTYGTRLFLPFTNYQVAFNNISVVDPLYTFPFLVCIVVMMFYRKAGLKRRKWLHAAFGVSSFYLLLTFGLKANVHQKFRTSLKIHSKEYNELNTTPTIFNAVLWSAVAYDDDTLHVAEYSYLNRKVPIIWYSYPRNLDLLKKYKSEALEVYKWFGDGNYFALENNDTLDFFTTKFGRMRLDKTEAHETFMFYSRYYKDKNGQVQFKSKSPKESRGSGTELQAYFNVLLERIGF